MVMKSKLNKHKKQKCRFLILNWQDVQFFLLIFLLVCLIVENNVKLRNANL